MVSGTGRFFRGSEAFGSLRRVVIVRGVWQGEDGGLIMVGSSRGGKDGRFIWYSQSIGALVVSAFMSMLSGMRDVGVVDAFSKGLRCFSLRSS